MLAGRDQFFATVLHELRNPLAPIASAVEVLARCGDESPSVCGARGVIQRQLRLLTRLVDDLADVSQIVRGQVDLELEKLDLADVVPTAVETARPLIDARQHALTIEVPRDRLIVQGDGVRLAQVMSNLLINAAKYTQVGGHVTVVGECAGTLAVLRVRDDGIGLEKEMLQRIFEPFIQAAPRSQTARGGLGIGLAVARQLIELHGGTIVARSEGIGRGSEFTIALPLETPQPVSSE